MNSGDVILRKYKEQDYDEVLEVCADTGFLGDPIDKIFIDRKLFSKMILDPFLKKEPEHTFVVDTKEGIKGYLAGTSNPNFHRKTTLNGVKSVLKMGLKSFYGHYMYSPRSERFVKYLFFKALGESPKHPKNAGHLHINIAKEYRGTKLGEKLIPMYEEMLKEEGMFHYYGTVFSSKNKRDEKLYKRFGFKKYDKVPNNMFYPEKKDMYLLTVYKTLDNTKPF